MATASTSAVPVRQPSRLLGAFAWAVVAYNILVILWGAVVRATGSGAGCGDRWPLCNGDFVPHHPRLATIIEFAHRSMSGIATILIIGLAVWVFYSTPRGDRSRKSAIASVFFLVTEALLGAALVLGGYVEHNISTARVVMQSIHFTNTMVMLAALGVTAWWVSQREHANTGAPADGKLVWPAWVAAISTIVVGATGAVAALADTLFPSTSLREALAADFAASAPLLVRMRWIHPAAAVIGFCCVLWLARHIRSRLSTTVVALLALQIVLGIVDVLTLAPTWMQIVHLLAADIYWIALVALVADTLWPDRRQRPAMQV